METASITNNNPQTSSVQTESQKKYEQVTTHRAWRHTIGRISCAARIPLYLVGMLFQMSKTALKAVVAPMISLIQMFANSQKLDPWTIEGVVKDGLTVVRIADRIANSVACVVFAPPKDYRSFERATHDIQEILTCDLHHAQHDGITGIKKSVESLVKHVMLDRPLISQQISPLLNAGDGTPTSKQLAG